MNIQSAVTAVVLGCFIATSNLFAQTDTQPAKTPRWSVLVPGGKLVPTGAQRHTIGRGNLTAAQLAYVARPTFAMTSTVVWARSRDIATPGDPKLDAFTYDVGAEFRAPHWLAGKGLSFSPFAGAGAGGRSYNYRKLALDATHNAAGYVSAGGEVGIRRLGVRLEARDYVAGFKPLDGAGAARTGNDVVVMAGLRWLPR
jgi:hypothetical protein